MAKSTPPPPAPKAVKPSTPAPAWTRWLTWLGLPAIFLLLLAIYFQPVFDGQSLQMGDIQSYAGMSEEVRSYRESSGEEAFWSNSQFSGMPTYQLGLRYPGNLFMTLKKVTLLGLPAPVSILFLTFLGFYLLCISLRLNPWLSALGALAFAFSSYFFIIMEAGHTSKGIAIAYMAPFLAGVIMAYRGQILAGAVIAAITFALQIAANHVQISYYLGLTTLVLAIAYGVDAIRNKQLPQFLKASAALAFAVALGIAPNASLLMTTNEYAAETIRGKSELKPAEGEQESSGLDREYALRWSYGPVETLTLMIPNLYGGASGTAVDPDSKTYDEIRSLYGQNASRVAQNFPTYWGDQPFTSGPVYVGAIICFLFILGLQIVKGPLKWGLLAATLLTMMLSWGRHFPFLTDLFFNYFPLYNKFRAVAMLLTVAELTMPLLAVLALDRFVNRKQYGLDFAQLRKPLLISAGVTGGLALLLALAGSAFFNFRGESDEQLGAPDELLRVLYDHRQSMLQADALRAAGLIALAAGLLYFWAMDKIKSGLALGVLSVLVLGDMWSVNKRYLDDSDFAPRKNYAKRAPNAADKEILKDKDPNYRVLNFHGGNIERTFNESQTSFFHKSVGGYHAAKLRRYQDLISKRIQPEMQQVIESLQGDSATSATFDSALRNAHTLNMLNTRYLIFSPDQPVFRNEFTQGNAWFVKELQWVENADAELEAMNTLDTRIAAVVDSRFRPAVGDWSYSPDTAASIRLTAYSPNELKYAYNASTPQLAVFSEIYYNSGKGWKAYIDGQFAEHFRANYVLRAMKLPAGQHEIVFRMEPASYARGELIALITSIVLLLLAAALLGWQIWQRRGGKTQTA